MHCTLNLKNEFAVGDLPSHEKPIKRVDTLDQHNKPILLEKKIKPVDEHFAPFCLNRTDNRHNSRCWSNENSRRNYETHTQH